MRKSVRYLNIIMIMLIAATSMLSGCKSSKSATKRKDKSEYLGGLTFNPEHLKGEDKRIVEEALTWLGTPYRYGGSDYSGTDCSGLTMKVYFKALGLSIPRNSAQQQKFCKAIKKGALTTGDLLFFATGKDKKKVSHVGLYLGDGQFIHASASRGVIISNVNERYYTSNYHSSGHVSRKSDKNRNKSKSRQAPEETKKSSPSPSPVRQEAPKRLETEPISIELDEAIESKIDSIYSTFLE
ncbi:NlpC/P60 family protein [Barnesiella sp. WM24]|uniref:C40 family peptidase n=1 Tax=Barnesiella sp. WM24 TaxID=2558278 RepID=UPI0010715E50|nr:C40 family peptidase [Barnesiella sp. WM24]TFU94271.1 NlpC/P60 family protein [Barnesiella sp. WM24]